MKFGPSQLSYCTNIHPAESWPDTRQMLAREVLPVRDQLAASGALPHGESFGIGLRLSARAATELLDTPGKIDRFRSWLDAQHCHVFTLNGFPYGDFHGTRVKEQVFQPDWTHPNRLLYTRKLFTILARIARPDTGGSVSTLPGSHKSFHARETEILTPLHTLATELAELSHHSGIDLHLGLEPEPFGHFENTRETLAFFQKLLASAPDPAAVRRHIGVNYDACHFALQFDEPAASLDALTQAGIRLSKIHLSNALALDPRQPEALQALRAFDEPTYFHQTIVRTENGTLHRFPDLPDFLHATSQATPPPWQEQAAEARVHFHIPLDAEPAPPLGSTRAHLDGVLAWRALHPAACPHFEIETYTWAVLPPALRRPITQQIAAEFLHILTPP